ncbi:mulatexin [Ricinus communis]|uniref:Nutrient reservoir, putative n=1 Tax=Ricinus communis TaxID=3988 RepID=B9SJ44_RICCO|nr:mulatexin [Ricinus communis]EEF36353.1 nutrient reservoir, putative [Ricinus communis]|eukprot:XP_002526013.1 mulatexin [Ricinus communis]
MSLKFRCLDSMMLLNYFLLVLIISCAAPTLGLDSRKLDETPTVPAGPTDEKCTPCNPTPPPPPPPSPCPPPPALPPPSPKKPPSSYCPPPPPSFIYITGPPGNLYPIDNDYSDAGRVTGLPVLIGCGLFGLLLRFGL